MMSEPSVRSAALSILLVASCATAVAGAAEAGDSAPAAPADAAAQGAVTPGRDAPPSAHLRRRGARLEGRIGRRLSFSCDLAEALRYTPVGGLEPGLLCTWRGAADRPTELVLDTGATLGAPGDWLLGPRVRWASGPMAEAGLQLHALTDTSDGWRTSRLQSSLSFALQNRPDADLFRRTGLVAFATARPFERLLVGAEYRVDDYASLPSRDGVWTLPHADEAVWRNPAIAAGRMGSILLRAEWSSVPAGQIDSVWRHPETSLVSTRAGRGSVLFRSVNTLEIARPALGGEAGLSFSRLVSDQTLVADQGRLRGLRLRLRLGRSWGAPPQKGEALGGWSALRGYGFKRYRGDLSLLGMAEYRRDHLAGFFDVGGVHERAGWSGALASVGARMYLWRDLNLSLAWKATGPGRQLFPSVRLQLSEGW